MKFKNSDMSNTKKKYAIAWREQTEKLKEKLFSLAGNEIYFEQGKLEHAVSQVQGDAGNSQPTLKYI